MNLIQAFENQRVEGITEKPEKIVETFISKLFFYPDKVYKVYKYDNNFIGNFGDLNFRKNFLEQDFAWNNRMSPDIYLHLKNVKNNNNFYVNSRQENAEDYYIEMKRIDCTENLTDLLLSDKISKDDLKKLTHELLKKIFQLTKEQKPKMKKFFNIPYLDIYTDGLEALREWGYLISNYINKEETDNIINTAINKIQTMDYFTNCSKSDLIVNIDNHSDNIVMINGKPGFIDIFMPKPYWRVRDPFWIIARLAMDVEVLKSKEYAEILLKTYKEYNDIPSSEVQIIHEIYSGFLKVDLYYSYKRPDLGQRYLQYVRKKIKTL